MAGNACRFIAATVFAVLLLPFGDQAFAQQNKYPHQGGKVERTELFLCNASKPFMTIEYVSYRQGQMNQARHEDLPRGECIATGLLGSRIVYFSMYYKTSRDGDPHIYRAAGNKSLHPDAMEARIVDKMEVYSYDMILCSPPNGHKIHPLRASNADRSFREMQFCFPGEVMRLYTHWIVVPNVQMTLEL